MCLALTSCKDKVSDGFVAHQENSAAEGHFVYSSDENGNLQIWEYANGIQTEIVADVNSENWWPRLSPNGEELIYYKSPLGNKLQKFEETTCWKRGMLTKVSVQLFEADPIWTHQGQTNWSHDAKSLVFSALNDSSGHWQIFTSNSEGKEPTPISKRAGYDYFDPVFSLDDQSIFCSVVHEGESPESVEFEIFEIDRITGEETRLTFNNTRDHHPDISIDGAFLAFESLDDPDYLSFGKWNIHKLDLTTLEETPMITTDNLSFAPMFSQDGRFLYFINLDILRFQTSLVQYELPNGPSLNVSSDSVNSINVDPF